LHQKSTKTIAKTQVQTTTPEQQKEEYQTVILPTKKSQKPRKKRRKTREQTITAQSCCPRQGKDKDHQKTTFL
jgi:hypothetical protein